MEAKPADIGPRLAQALVLADDVTLRELDRLAGLKSQNADRILKGARTNIGLGVVVAYAQVFGCSIDWLCGREDAAPSIDVVRASVARARTTYAQKHPPRGRRGAGKRALDAFQRSRSTDSDIAA